jgi:hypothetical protein
MEAEGVPEYDGVSASLQESDFSLVVGMEAHGHVSQGFVDAKKARVLQLGSWSVYSSWLRLA